MLMAMYVDTTSPTVWRDIPRSMLSMDPRWTITVTLAPAAGPWPRAINQKGRVRIAWRHVAPPSPGEGRRAATGASPGGPGGSGSPSGRCP